MTTHDTLTSVGAAGAVASPFWLPWLHTTSEVAALLAPILGVLWLLIQIAAWWRRRRAEDAFRADLTRHMARTEPAD